MLSIVRVDWFHWGKPVWVSPLHAHGVTAIILIHREGGDVDGAVNANLVHRRHHLVAGNVRRPVWHAVPRSLPGVCRISMNLGVNDCCVGRPLRSLLCLGTRSVHECRTDGRQCPTGLQHRSPINASASAD